MLPITMASFGLLIAVFLDRAFHARRWTGAGVIGKLE
jgi:hypothetical protein